MQFTLFSSTDTLALQHKKRLPNKPKAYRATPLSLSFLFIMQLQNGLFSALRNMQPFISPTAGQFHDDRRCGQHAASGEAPYHG